LLKEGLQIEEACYATRLAALDVVRNRAQEKRLEEALKLANKPEKGLRDPERGDLV